MNKEEYIKRYGKVAYEKHLQQSRDWYAAHPAQKKAADTRWYAAHSEQKKAAVACWVAANPEKVLANNQEHSCKGGKYYEKWLEYLRTGLQAERNKIRAKHRRQYQAIKQATPNSVLHHEWIPGTAKYRGLALVEKVPHQNGIIKPILILEGEITLFTEKKI